jgi:predicted DNA-binding transcriptional regulator AlpA
MPDGALPFIPRALRAEFAALYVGVSESWWLAAVKAGDAPAAVYLTPRLPVWLREDLDAWLDARAGRNSPSKHANPLDAFFDARRRAREART